MLGFLLGLVCGRGLERGVAAVLVLVLPVSAAASRGYGVTYGGRRVRGAGGESGGGGGAPGAHAGGGEAHGGALALAEVPLALSNQRPLVALHPLQLLLRGHPPARLAAGGLLSFRGRRQALQGTLGSLLVGRGTGLEMGEG